MLAFLTDLEQERGLARNTVNAYRSDLVQFGAFLADRTSSATPLENAQRAARASRRLPLAAYRRSLEIISAAA